jgi:sialate O-acetylesterase
VARASYEFDMCSLRLIPFFAAVLAVRCAGLAAPELAPLFQDHAVLQCDKPLPVWGRAAPGEHVSVAFAGQAVGTTAGSDGRWIAVLAPLAANASGADLVVTGTAQVTLHDIVVGEVWLCAGQSNMEFAVDDGREYQVDQASEEVEAARYPLIRQFKVARQVSATPMETARGDWTACTPESVRVFTAVGYFFARDLYVRLNVPVGILNSTCAGTPLESWMSPVALGAFPGFANGRPVSGTAAGIDPSVPSSLFNGMIHPLLPYAIRGALWYQGESDVGRAASYGAHFPAMISAWRAHFGEGDFPFYWVQLANFSRPGKEVGEPWAFLREAQSRALSLPETGQAIAIDIGEAGNLHPRNKQEVGRRLALLAKAKVYAIPVDFSGPEFSRIAIEGSSVRVFFTFAGDGLTASGKPLQSFEVAGADREFHPAAAVIQADTVIVQSFEVRLPVAVRYAWRDNPDANLYNGAGLPAAPFRSDDW